MKDHINQWALPSQWWGKCSLVQKAQGMVSTSASSTHRFLLPGASCYPVQLHWVLTLSSIRTLCVVAHQTSWHLLVSRHCWFQDPVLKSICRCLVWGLINFGVGPGPWGLNKFWGLHLGACSEVWIQFMGSSLECELINRSCIGSEIWIQGSGLGSKLM